MKKVNLIIATIYSFFIPTVTVFADQVEDVFGKVVPPAQVRPLTDLGGAGGLSFFLSRIIELIYVVAGLLFVFMLVFSALQWITSGGEKEAVGKARSRLTYAIIGIVLLSLTFVILRVIGQITGFSFFAP